MISPGSAELTLVSCTSRCCTAPLGSRPRAASACMDVFANMDLSCASKTRIIPLRHCLPCENKCIVVFKETLLMNTIGKAVSNRSGFLRGKPSVLPHSCVVPGTVPLVVQFLLQAQCPDIWHAFGFGAGLDCRHCGSHSVAYAQLFIGMGHLPWPPDDADASSW